MASSLIPWAIAFLGTDKLRAAWEGYFKMVSDYSILHSEIFAYGIPCRSLVQRRGPFLKDGELKKENSWRTPAAWRAVVKDGKIALWQVYADNGTDPGHHAQVFLTHSLIWYCKGAFAWSNLVSSEDNEDAMAWV